MPGRWMLELIEPARVARRSFAFGCLGVTRAAGTPALRGGAGSFAQPLRQGTCHSVRRCCGPSMLLAAFIAGSAHRAPPSGAPVFGEGDLWGGIFKRWAGEPAHRFGC